MRVSQDQGSQIQTVYGTLRQGCGGLVGIGNAH